MSYFFKLCKKSTLSYFSIKKCFYVFLQKCKYGCLAKTVQKMWKCNFQFPTLAENDYATAYPEETPFPQLSKSGTGQFSRLSSSLWLKQWSNGTEPRKPCRVWTHCTSIKTGGRKARTASRLSILSLVSSNPSILGISLKEQYP